MGEARRAATHTHLSLHSRLIIMCCRVISLGRFVFVSSTLILCGLICLKLISYVLWLCVLCKFIVSLINVFRSYAVSVIAV